MKQYSKTSLVVDAIPCQESPDLPVITIGCSGVPFATIVPLFDNPVFSLTSHELVCIMILIKKL